MDSQNILQKKIPDRSVELERERLNSLINSMGDGVIAIDENFKVVISNGAALNILDVNSSLIDKKIDEIMTLIDKNSDKLNLQQVINDSSAPQTSRDWRLLYPDGEKINIYISIAPVRLGFGQKGQKGYVILLRDITREKSLEEERDEFVSVVSHELRTPITIAEGNLSNARFIFSKSGLVNITVENALKEAHNQLHFLSAMINDLAMLSRAEHGDLNVDVTSINVYELMKELENSYQPEANKKHLNLSSELDPSLELLRSCKLYVQEILQNFITNAIKYTPSGNVIIGAKTKNNGIEFYVEDTGLGISKADKQKIFDKFFRSENFQTRENSGTGLGLYVTVKLAKLLKAKINIESELGKGSTFFIFIPNLN